MKKFISLAAASLVILFASNTASARPIEGIINFVGGAVITNTGNTIATVTFDPGVLVNGSDNLATGDFDGLEGTAAAFTTLDVSNVPLYTLWTAGTFTFQVSSISVNSFTPGVLGAKSIGGSGYLTSTDPLLDQTAGTWIITSNGTKNAVSFSATTVPAPAGTALLGLCLLGFAFSRRNKKA